MTIRVALIGYGAIAAEICRAAEACSRFEVAAILARPSRLEALQWQFPGVLMTSEVSALPDDANLVVECAGHQAVDQYGPDILRSGRDLVLVSVGALAEERLLTELERAAEEGGASLTLVAGAVPGIDALRAASLGRLERVTYLSRKPPSAWRGTPAEGLLNLERLMEPATFFEGNARTAARDYPKNANITATIALAGIGFEKTEVRLVADPGSRRNRHEIEAEGDFGSMRVVIDGRPLESNPKTSSLAAMSAIRAIRNASDRIRI